MPRQRARFGTHPTLEDALAVVSDAQLPEDIDAILPAQRKLSIAELVGIGRACSWHVSRRVSRAKRAEFDRLAELVDDFLAGKASKDLGLAARRDAEFARGALKVIALTAQATSESGQTAAALIGEAAQLALKALAKDPAAQRMLIRELCARFR